MIQLFSRRAVLLTACSCIIGLASCEKTQQNKASGNASQQGQADSTANAANGPAAPKEPEYVITYPKGSPYEGLTPPAGAKTNPFEEIPKIIEAHKDNPNWADKHADIKGLFLQNMKKDYLFVLQQQGANEMLRHELFPHYYQDPSNLSMLSTIGYYTEQLVEAKSEDAELIFKCLRALKGHWPDEQISEVALLTAKRVQARPVSSSEDTITSRNGKYRQIYARELKKMAQ